MAMSCSELPAPGASSCYSTLLPDSARAGALPTLSSAKQLLHITPRHSTSTLACAQTKQSRLGYGIFSLWLKHSLYGCMVHASTCSFWIVWSDRDRDNLCNPWVWDGVWLSRLWNSHNGWVTAAYTNVHSFIANMSYTFNPQFER